LHSQELILKKIANNKTIVEQISENQFNKLSDTETSQGILGVVKKRAAKKREYGKIIISLEKISDPGNLGTIIRTAFWFGIKDIILSQGSADVYSPKAIRSTQGGIFHTEITENADLSALLNNLYRKGYKIYLLSSKAETVLESITPAEKCVIVIGNESHGISEELFKSEYNSIAIKGFSKCESLNAAIAAGIAMHYFKSI
jgi:TrmH family RNA methyltransferase